MSLDLTLRVLCCDNITTIKNVDVLRGAHYITLCIVIYSRMIMMRQMRRLYFYKWWNKGDGNQMEWNDWLTNRVTLLYHLQ